MKRWHLILMALAVMVGMAGAGLFFAHTVRGLNRRLVEGQTAMQVGRLIADHVQAQDGRWPAGWDDLRPVFRRRYGRELSEAELDQCRRLLEVDWSADPHQLARLPDPTEARPPFEVVRCKSGLPAGPTPRHDANRLIHQALIEWARRPATQPAMQRATQPATPLAETPTTGSADG